jgi:hypothetical protein
MPRPWAEAAQACREAINEFAEDVDEAGEALARVLASSSRTRKELDEATDSLQKSSYKYWTALDSFRIVRGDADPVPSFLKPVAKYFREKPALHCEPEFQPSATQKAQLIADVFTSCYPAMRKVAFLGLSSKLLDLHSRLATPKKPRSGSPTWRSLFAYIHQVSRRQILSRSHYEAVS